MKNISLEQIREDANFISSAVEAIDNLTTRINGTRWQYELLRRNPSLGVVTDPRTGQQRTVTPEEFRHNFDILVEERVNYVAVITDILGVQSLDEVREFYMRLVSAHQRYTGLKELDIMVEAGHPAAMKEAAENQNLMTTEERRNALATALAGLATVNASVTLRPISDLVIARILPSA